VDTSQRHDNIEDYRRPECTTLALVFFLTKFSQQVRLERTRSTKPLKDHSSTKIDKIKSILSIKRQIFLIKIWLREFLNSSGSVSELLILNRFWPDDDGKPAH